MKSNLQKAIDLLEENGFHVSRAYEENNRDAGNQSPAYTQDAPTGAIILRVIPKVEK
jgi:hypothetical protein